LVLGTLAYTDAMNVCIFCSANDLHEKYTQPAIELATKLAAAGHTLVWGGSDYGLMKVVADAVQKGGGRLVGISMEQFKLRARKNADEIVITRNLSERKAMLLERADVIVMLVGGLGTLDETTEALELKKQGGHNKPIIILNTDGFYDGLQLQLQRIADEGFLPVQEQDGIAIRPLIQLVQFASTPEAALELIEVAIPASP
jgi:uncharacterized protein (TIGR00730 family)